MRMYPSRLASHHLLKIGAMGTVISQDYRTKNYSNMMKRSPLRLATILPSLMAISTVVVEMFSRDVARPSDLKLW